MLLLRLTTLYFSNCVSSYLFLSYLPLAYLFLSRLLPYSRAYLLHRHLTSPLPHISVTSNLHYLKSQLSHICVALPQVVALPYLNLGRYLN